LSLPQRGEDKLSTYMCGICGVVSVDDRVDRTDPAYLDRLACNMSEAMFHRGPDAAGALADPDLALGMRRLSIIDRATGLQPIYNEDHTIAVIYNGEIYNFVELRAELEQRGHVFRTRCDTEVIVHAYEEWGDESLQRLRGMFGLAIYDRRAPRGQRRVLLARDRLGIKPLYYTRVGDMLLFASEVRALLASGVVPRTLSPAGLESYLLFGSVSEPETLIDGVHSIPPGHALSVPVGSPMNGAAPRPYWTLAPALTRRVVANGSPAPAPASTLRTLLEDSVRTHLISDEPLGIFLSGGVDSTTLAALASRVRSGVRCYTISFDEREFDESDVARRTAQRLGVEHCELRIDAREMLDGMDRAIDALDQPSVDGINTWCVSAAVRRAGAKVALSGLGGDELFGGYRTFRWMPRLARLSSIARHTPSPLRWAGAQAIHAAGAWAGRTEDSDRLASIWREPEALPHPFFFTRTVFGPEDVQHLLHGNGHQHAWRAWIDDTTGAVAQRGVEPFTAVSYLELRSYMLNTLLRDADAMSMAHSLELRVPLLDHPVVEFVASQPDAVKQHNGRYKPLLVEALGDLLPDEVSTRPKRGFTFPWQQWTRGPLASRIGARLRQLEPPLAECVDQDTVIATWQAFRAGRCGWLRPWSLFILNEWSARHL
jgi:asparagine synthase (glutamine-hydrolysing)